MNEGMPISEMCELSSLYCFSFLKPELISSLLREMWWHGSLAGGVKRRVSIFPESQYPDTGYRQVWSRAQQMEGRRRMSKLNSNTRVSQTGSMQNVIENFLFIICNIISLTKYAAYNGLSSSYLLPISSSTHTRTGEFWNVTQPPPYALLPILPLKYYQYRQLHNKQIQFRR